MKRSMYRASIGRKKTYKEFFSDDKERINIYEEWIEKRNIWAEHQKVLTRTRKIFTELYKNILI